MNRQTSSYMAFVSNERTRLKEKFIREHNREPSFTELGKYIGEVWKTLTKEAKQEYLSSTKYYSNEIKTDVHN